MKRKKSIHPEYASWWEKNERKFVRGTGIAALILLLLPLIILEWITSDWRISLIYIVLLQVNFFLFYVTFSRNERNL